MSSSTAARIGAIAFALWGILHVAGGGVILATLGADGPTAALGTLSSALPAAARTDRPGPVAAAVLAFHGWNFVWIGALVTVVAVRLCWRNIVLGFWCNLAIVAAADAGMVATLLLPGLIRPSEGAAGLLLAAAGTVFGALGVWRRTPR